MVAVAMATCTVARALDYGPFTLNAFLKYEVVRGNNHCNNCQLVPDATKQENWGDALAPGSIYKTTTNSTLLFQPWLGAHFDLGGGFKVSGLISQRWRNNNQDIPGFLYEDNVALSHEEFGSLRVGGMTTRGWSVADYPYGTQLGLADVFGAAGAGYGIVTQAVRYTSRPFDVAGGDLVLEGTAGNGNVHFKVNVPSFYEIYVQYHRGDLVLDAVVQSGLNGGPQAWSHGPFTALTYNPADDRYVNGKPLLGGYNQGIQMLLGRYQLSSKVQLSGGIRRNHWSGADAVITTPGPPAQWNNMFNVDWGGTLNGVSNPGYPAHSIDFMLGGRYFWNQWVAYTGLAHLGKAWTANPSERGQSNAATVPTAGLEYHFANGFILYGLAATVHYARVGLAPLSMPANSSFTNVDPRVTQNGYWYGMGSLYVF
jgi:hypothetical protein